MSLDRRESKPHVFLSYSHLDNESSGDEPGWVTTLRKNVNVAIDTKLGEKVDVWMDHELPGHTPFPARLKKRVEAASVLLVVRSEGYLKSEWCTKERELFLASSKNRSFPDFRIFVVESSDSTTVLPEGLRDLTGYRFWEPTGGGGKTRKLGYPTPLKEDREYWNVVNDVAEEIAGQLKRIWDAPPAVPGVLVPVERVEDQPAVLLAEVPDHLYSHRLSVQRFLKDKGIRVVPDRSFAEDPGIARKELEAAIAKSVLYVQLLGPMPSRWCEPRGETCVDLQYEAAAAAGIPAVHWLSPDLDVALVQDEAYGAFLGGLTTTVRKVGLEEFKHQVLVEFDQILQEKKTDPPPPVDAFVFVNADACDSQQARVVQDLLDQRGFGYIIREAETVDDAASELEGLYRDSTGAVVIYGESQRGFVERQLSYCRKFRRGDPLRDRLAVFVGPPPDPVKKDKLRMKLAGMTTIDARNGLREEEFESYLDVLRAAAEARAERE